MTTVDACAPAPSTESAAAPKELEAPGVAIPTLLTAITDDEIRSRLDSAARKGRLPGLRLESGSALFEVREIGRPFESALVAATRGASGVAAREIGFELRLRPLVPTVFAVVLVASVWPGIYLVDSMFRHYFSWYSSVETWWWYVPMNVLTSPWAFWSAMKKSRASARVEAAGVVKKLERELGAEVAGAR